MGQWAVDIANNPANDYNLVVEILYEDLEVAVVHYGKQGLEMKVYPTEQELVIPVEWLLGVLTEAKRSVVQPEP